MSKRQVDELLEAIRLTQEFAQLPAVPGYAWFDAYSKFRPKEAEELRLKYVKALHPASGGMVQEMDDPYSVVIGEDSYSVSDTDVVHDSVNGDISVEEISDEV